MNRKKKQKTVNRQQKKQEEAARRNAFFRSMKEIMVKCGCGEAYALVPEISKMAIYKSKISSLKIHREDCGCLSDEMFNRIAAQLDKECQWIKIPVGHSAAEMTLKHFYTLGMSIILLQRWMESAPFADATHISDLIVEKMDLKKAEKFANEQSLFMLIFS
jgi:hypothetical protein